MSERRALEELLKDAEAMVAKIKARLADAPLQAGGGSEKDTPIVDASAGSAIDLVQSQKTSDNTGNY